MPIACGNTVLTGSSGSVAFKPAATDVCLRDFTDFPAGTDITVPAGHGFVRGDVVQFHTVDGGVLDTALTAATDVFIVGTGDTTVQVATTADGTPITLNGDGGDGSADTELPAHINLALSEFTTVCHVESFELSLDRDQIETTSLGCGCATGDTAGLAQFKTYQAGYIDGTGSMVVQFGTEQGTMASRLMRSALRQDQTGCEVRLYVNAVCGANGEVDNDASAYIEAPVSILGFSFSVSPEEVITATVNFTLSGQPTHFSF